MSAANYPPEAAPAHGAMRSSHGYRLQCGRMMLDSIPLHNVFAQRPGRAVHVATINAEIFALAHQDRRMAEILTRSRNTIDGRVLQGICKLLYPAYEIIRQNGSNFVVDLAGHCQRTSQRLFLLGASEESNARAVAALSDRFPELEIAGYSPPIAPYPFDRQVNQQILEPIRGFRAHHVVVCFGPPKQEYWIDDNAAAMAAMGVHCAYGLGGTIDFISGVKPRAPKWVEFVGAEWLFRFLCEPRARFFRTLTMFKMPFYAARTQRFISPAEGEHGR
ncbi:MAG: WecB/TagA/CpsF family glycosyltransferase [Candidatus Acidiferrales bacterium]